MIILYSFFIHLNFLKEKRSLYFKGGFSAISKNVLPKTFGWIFGPKNITLYSKDTHQCKRISKSRCRIFKMCLLSEHNYQLFINKSSKKSSRQKNGFGRWIWWGMERLLLNWLAKYTMLSIIMFKLKFLLQLHRKKVRNKFFLT